ncbi:hypothetical protein MFIFM68171_10419 [Madurella fahalii]|uniref:Rhodopsin domain-containing protein n=1 Tax=Madurella fahalii TaxID=1157608 RepID=A0ABQ0GR57_9PEZI
MQFAAQTIASWPQPNYVNPEVHSPVSVIVELFLLCVVTILLSIRLYTRCRISRGFGRDDVLIFMAYLPAVAFVIIEVVAYYKLDRDKHIWDVRPELAAPSLQVGLAEQILFAIATCCTKLSVLALIYRITSVASGWPKNLTIIVAVVVALDAFAFILVSIFQCTPISDIWTISITPQRCIDHGVHLLVASIINTVQDFVIVLVPIKTVIGLDLPVTQRATVLLLFAGGLLVCIAGAVRTHFTWLMVSSPDGDINWHSYDMMLASSIELLLGITCASAPATKPFFTLYATRLPQLVVQTTRKLNTVRRKGKRSASKTTLVSIYIIHDIDIQPAFPKALGVDMSRESGLTTAPDLNKPLPEVPKVTLDLRIGRSLTWNDMGSPRSPSSVLF